MLWRHRKWSARDDLHVQGCLILSQVGLLFPVNHAPEIGVPDRLRSGDLLHERQACCLDYTTGTEMERVNGVAPSSRPWHGRILLLNHTRKKWCLQPDSHRQPDA